MGGEILSKAEPGAHGGILGCAAHDETLRNEMTPAVGLDGIAATGPRTMSGRRGDESFPLRRKIEDDPSHPTRIVTVHGVGYRFTG